MTAPPDPSISGDEDKCPICSKPLSKHTYEEQVACTARKAALDKLSDEYDKSKQQHEDAD
tara:strand:- start:986 stop:1165 length:180 start_codon:yes stop_codon:yes gene_type:complete